MKRVGFLALILFYLVLPPLASASFFTYYPLLAVIDYLEPPLVFEPLYSDYVSGYTGPNATSITVNVNITVQMVISLVERAAIFWDKFTSDPIASGRVIPLSGNWSWDGEALVLHLEQNPAGYGGEAIALLNVSLPPSGKLYFNFDVWFDSSTSEGYGEAVLMVHELAFYTVGLRYSSPSYATIWQYDGSWTLLNYAGPYTLFPNTWYDISVVVDLSTHNIELYSTNRLILTATGGLAGSISRIGFGGYVRTAPLIVRFDDVVVTIGKPPYTVNVTGLEPGWYVEIRDENGNVLTSGTADRTGTAVLNFWYIEFVANATIVVYDSNGNPVAAATFDWIIGGDVYRLWNPLVEGFQVTLFSLWNRDVNTYTARLVLNSFSLIKGYVYNATLWFTEPGGTVSTAIAVIDNSVVSTVAGDALLLPDYRGYAYMYVRAENGTRFTLSLTVISTLGGVTVYYPATVNVYVYDPAPRVGPPRLLLIPREAVLVPLLLPFSPAAAPPVADKG